MHGIMAHMHEANIAWLKLSLQTKLYSSTGLRMNIFIGCKEADMNATQIICSANAQSKSYTGLCIN